jgi:hypothetical protein
MDTAPKDRDILILWQFTNHSDNRYNCKQVGIGYFNGIFEEHHPGSGFWNGYIVGGHVTTRSNNCKPIAWMELPPTDVEEK